MNVLQAGGNGNQIDQILLISLNVIIVCQKTDVRTIRFTSKPVSLQKRMEQIAFHDVQRLDCHDDPIIFTVGLQQQEAHKLHMRDLSGKTRWIPSCAAAAEAKGPDTKRTG